ncbi:hypothetical protein LTR10_022815 [Elasticomyces elasticus]|uniref:Zn(2)-C6 fungal-type domain-containing protein n=1 Tax=Exophiala sideris TaxID=1016849 RepID=A0ABR0JHZ3_9EURO|nr:hypothetical protein LTR10_022815 [Elasticomyces elasticus]KAK5033583.1 hypothetical protein LTS07_003888 [Exophiala sideris]KAK5041922.1 hypothetical protein LTR13_001727 [Exophiala sideris]KAK5064127.1 hypothetical protein LTR69_003896 [Exophiala sideris]KAK5185190.1 hypothetical protein LTR44_002178 [Eurotiomycetes sp. CCFEE 6388]
MPSRAKKYGQSCLLCRKRKVRCDGGRPSCAKCMRIKECCVYSAHDSTVTRLQNALATAEQRLFGLERDLQGLLLLEPAQCRDTLRTITESLGPGFRDARHMEHAQSGTSDRASNYTSGHSLGAHQPDQHTPANDDGSTDEEENEEGYGATSRFHVDEHESCADQDHQSSYDDPVQVEYHKRWLTSNARFHKSFEQMAYAGLHSDDQIDAETAKILLRIYWTWQAPLHNCVYRRSFFRDMVLKGPYFSDFLLSVIYAHAARHIQPSDPNYARLLQGEQFLDRAKLLLLDELKKDRPAIPTIQGLLILGGRQCAVGRNSEGWLYTGMAIRMIKDLGLHLPRRLRLASTEPDDLETLKRVYLSAYAWDKSISLCLGRPPSLTTMLYPSDCLYDNTDDQELWQPFYLGGLESIYAPTPCYNTTTFSHFVKLSTIVNDAFDSVFGSRSRKFVFARLKHIEEKLYELYRTLPAELQMNESVASLGYPPPHICCLNILYHTMFILIYRPYFLNKGVGLGRDETLLEHATTVCTREATAVNKIFQAYGRAYANKRQTYLLSYCVYTAATIEVKQVGDPDPAISQAAVERLATTLAMLEEEAKQTPGIRRSIEIIRIRLQKQRQSSQTVEMAPTQQGPIPSALMNAFPAVSGDLEPSQLQYEALGGDTSNAHVYGTHGMPTLENAHNLPVSMDALSQWPVSEGSFDLWNIPTPDVGGGFVPDSLSWYTMIE